MQYLLLLTVVSAALILLLSSCMTPPPPPPPDGVHAPSIDMRGSIATSEVMPTDWPFSLSSSTAMPSTGGGWEEGRRIEEEGVMKEGRKKDMDVEKEGGRRWEEEKEEEEKKESVRKVRRMEETPITIITTTDITPITPTIITTPTTTVTAEASRKKIPTKNQTQIAKITPDKFPLTKNVLTPIKPPTTATPPTTGVVQAWGRRTPTRGAVIATPTARESRAALLGRSWPELDNKATSQQRDNALNPSFLRMATKKTPHHKKTEAIRGQTHINNRRMENYILGNFTLKKRRFGDVETEENKENTGDSEYTVKNGDYQENYNENRAKIAKKYSRPAKKLRKRRDAKHVNTTDLLQANGGDTEKVDDIGENEEESKHKKRRRRRRRGKGRGRRRGTRRQNDLSLWIDGRQVKMFSGYVMEIFAIHDGHVLPYILDPNFEKHLPVIPSEVESVNFTWQAGRRRYFYKFDRLYSQDEEILHAPVVSMATHGRVPKKPKVFSINIQCTGNASGVASFGIGLLIQSLKGKPLPGTPLRLQLRKECMQHGPDPECDQKCENGGVCDVDQRCLCPEGYMGQYCKTALCYPQCMNGGTCTTPGRCSCPPGFQGRHCEGGICRDKCENGGKCVQKDTCECPKGYYGNRCEFSKCVIPCVNGGRCRDVNKCRCPHGFAGDHCEMVLGQMPAADALDNGRCSRKCKKGSCVGSVCQCELGYSGRWCRRRSGKTVRRRIWL